MHYRHSPSTTAPTPPLYGNLELERHDLVLANGLPEESYLDTGNRAAFADSGNAIQLHPQFGRRMNQAALRWEAAGCAPLLVHGPQIDQVRAKLQRRAARLRRATLA